MVKKSPHEVLGVAPNASMDEITSAYREKAKMYHPDKVAHLGQEFRLLAEEKMKEINAAYDELRFHNSRQAQFSEDQEDFGVSHNPNLLEFFSFCGFNYGDRVSRVIEILGEPEKYGKVKSFDPYTTLYYFLSKEEFEDAGLEIIVDRSNGLIKAITVRESAIYPLRSIGVSDRKLLYLGQHADLITKQLGDAKSNDNDNFYEYELQSPEYPRNMDAPHGQISFTCPGFDHYKCSEITLHWVFF